MRLMSRGRRSRYLTTVAAAALVTFMFASAHAQMMMLSMNAWSQSATMPAKAEGALPMALDELVHASNDPNLDQPFEDIVTANHGKSSRAPAPSRLPSFQVSVHAKGFIDPDGVAVNPTTGETYVSEETVGRISVVTRQRARTVIDTSTPIISSDGMDLSGISLRAPEGIACSAEGDLYVVEDIPDGRLIHFRRAKDGTHHTGREIELPGSWDTFAWEDVDVGPRGELLVVGSDADYVYNTGVIGAFSGVMLYRDAEGAWWMIRRQYFTSFSAACFSTDGKRAMYACEFTGEVGWIDLTDHRGHGGTHPAASHVPEGVTVLPNDTLLVAEEDGNVVAIEPVTGHRQVLAQGLGNIASVKWDPVAERVLVTASEAGRIVALDPDEPMYRSTHGTFTAPRSRPLRTAVHVPEVCPKFLERVFARAGLHFGDHTKSEFSFRSLMNHLPMIAVNARATPIGDAAQDPVVQVQFAVFHPNQVGISGNKVSMSSGLFAVVMRSGKVIRTQVEGMHAAAFSRGQSDPSFPDQLEVVVPYPASVTVTGTGAASIQFMGLGQTPDYHVVIDPNNPDASYMVVDNGRGDTEQYRLQLAPDRERTAENVVISYSRELEGRWVRLSG